jgi:predicted phosphodiesterase
LILSATAKGFPRSPTNDYNQQINIDCGSAIVIGDSEIPDHDNEIFAMAVETAARLGVDTLIINGDFIDGSVFSKWAKTVDSGQSFSVELVIAKNTVKEFLKYFRSVYIVSGNHDNRLAIATNGQIWLGMFMDDIPGLNVSQYSFLNMNTPNGEWLICHPRNYSKIPLSTARDIAASKLKHVLVAHNHHLSVGHDRSGKFWVVDGGCCRDPLKTQYKAMTVTTHPEWIPGFVVIRNGVPIIISKKTFPVIMDMVK